MTFKEDVEKKIFTYIDKNIYPQIKKGTYGRGVSEEKDILTVHGHLKLKYGDN